MPQWAPGVPPHRLCGAEMLGVSQSALVNDTCMVPRTAGPVRGDTSGRTQSSGPQLEPRGIALQNCPAVPETGAPVFGLPHGPIIWML